MVYALTSVRVDGMPVDWDGCRKCAHINLRRDLVSGEMRLGGGDERITGKIYQSMGTMRFSQMSLVRGTYLGSEPHVLLTVASWKGAARAEPSARARIETAGKNLVR